MEKYSTYKIYKNEKTGDIVRKTLSEIEEFEKKAEKNQWVELDEEPETK